DHGRDYRPFGVDQITWITKAAAVCCSKAVFRLPHRALPRSQIRESSAQQNHNRFTRFNNFLDWLLARGARSAPFAMSFGALLYLSAKSSTSDRNLCCRSGIDAVCAKGRDVTPTMIPPTSAQQLERRIL